jgi:hypothetical protein
MEVLFSHLKLIVDVLKKSNIFLNFIFSNFLVQMLKCKKKEKKYTSFAHIDIKITPSKVANLKCFSVLPKLAQSAQTILLTHISFSMFPILNTNLCVSILYFGHVLNELGQQQNHDLLP